MQIAKNTVVSLHYEMLDSNNTVVDKTEEPISYLHGGYDGIFPLVEEKLHEKKAGDKVDVLMQPDDAFHCWSSRTVRRSLSNPSASIGKCWVTETLASSTSTDTSRRSGPMCSQASNL